MRVSRNSNFYFKIIATVGGTRRRLTGKKALCYLKSVIRGDHRIRHLGTVKLVAVGRRRFGHLRGTGILLHTRKRPPRACSVTHHGGVRVVSTAYPIMLHLRGGVGRRCIRRSGHSGRVIVCNGGKRTRMLNLMKRAAKGTVIVRGRRRTEGLSFDGSVHLCSRAAGSLSKFRGVIGCVRKRVSPGIAFRSCSAVYQRMTGQVPGVQGFTTSRSLVFFIDNGGDSGNGVLFDRYGGIGTGSRLVSDTRRVSDSLLTNTGSVNIYKTASAPG